MKNATQILETDLLDIVFENRNKFYGAYELRKHYNGRLYKAILVSIGIMALAVAFLMYQNRFMKKAKPLLTSKVYVLKLVKLIPPTEKQAMATPKKNVQTKKNNKEEGRIVITKEPVQKSKQPEPELLHAPLIPVGIPGEISGPSLDSGIGALPGHGAQPEMLPTVPDINPAIPQVSAELMPQFPGGKKALLKFLKRNMFSPEPIAEAVQVRIQFIVGYDGKLKGFEVLQDGGSVFNQEVIRVLKRMPDWIPGKTAGKNVSVYFSLPVTFMPME